MFRISLDILYIKIICPEFYLHGFDYSPDFFKHAYSYLSLIIMSIFMANCSKKVNVSYTMLMFLFLFAYVPNGSLYAQMDLDTSYMNISNLYWLCMISAYRLLPNMLSENKSMYIKHKNFLIKAVPYIFLIILLGFSYQYNGLTINLNLADVYDMRMESRDNPLGRIMGTLIAWAGSIVFPLTIVYAIKEKKFIKAMIFLFGQAAAFSINGTKTWLFIVVASIIGVLFIRRDKNIYHMPLMFAGINFVSYLEYLKFDTSFVANYIVRRVFFSTSLNNWYHILFFTDNEPLYFLHSSIGGLLKSLGFESPYPDSISLIIGQMYYSNETNASSGTIADAYDNFGLFGVIFLPFFVVFFLKLMDRMSVGLQIRYLLPLIIVTAIYLLNGNIFTVLLTYGYLFALWYIKYQKRDREDPTEKTAV